MGKTKLRLPAVLMLLWSLIALLTLSTATYAWFSYHGATNVTPMQGKISKTGIDLLISNNENGPFDQQCELILRGAADSVRPVSSADLTSFFASVQQNDSGISVQFQDVSTQITRRTVCGIVYLKSLNDLCDVYLDAEGLYFGDDPQALAAMRLGLRFTTSSGVQTYILRLDELGNTAGAESRQTVERNGTVVSGVDANRRPTLVNDPSVPISTYFFKQTDGADALCTLKDSEVGTVEYWLYLEGCDAQCINSAQSRNIALQLAFSGDGPDAAADGR